MLLKFVQNIQKSLEYNRVELTDEQKWQQLHTWYASELGYRLFESEKDLMSQSLSDLFGYYLLQCGCPEANAVFPAGSWLKGSRVSSCFCLNFYNKQGVSGLSELHSLPVQTDCIDVVVLPHVLECSSNPHEVLREVERVLIPEGHVVILGFNPWSLWNLLRIFPFTRKLAPWNAKFLSAFRVIDWLSLLGFDLIDHKGYFYRPPIQREDLMKKLNFIERLGEKFWPKFGAGYMLVARKRVQTLTPIKPKWTRQRKVLASGLEPMNRNNCE